VKRQALVSKIGKAAKTAGVKWTLVLKDLTDELGKDWWL